MRESHEEEATGHQTAPACYRSLDGCNKTPNEHNYSTIDVRLEVLPAHEKPLGADVCDVEQGTQPVVSEASEIDF